MSAAGARRGQRHVTELVYGAVGSLIAERPVSQVSVNVVAARAHVNPSTIYRRWGSIRRLIHEVASDEIAQLEPTEMPSYPEEVRALLERMVCFYSRESGRSALRALAGTASDKLEEPDPHLKLLQKISERHLKLPIDDLLLIDVIVAPIAMRALCQPTSLIGPAGMYQVDQAIARVVREFAAS